MTPDLPAASQAGPRFAPVPLLTPSEPVSWEGTGLHSGVTCQATVFPVEEQGIVFVCGGVEIPALADHVTDTTRCTVLGREGASVSTVEHLLAALSGLGIWAARVEVKGPEVPVLDGSAAPFTESLRRVGTKRIGEGVALIPGEGRVDQGEAYRRWLGSEADPSASFLLTGDHPLLAGQETSLRLNDPNAFAGEIAPCRTWALYEQVQALLERNLIRGGSLDNALLIYPDRYSSPLRREAEPARHKLLDLIGDMALVGAPVLATVTAVGGGHALNVELARALRAEYRRATPGGETSGGPEPSGRGDGY